MSQKKKLLYVQTSGVDTPKRTYAPFVLAACALTLNDLTLMLAQFYVSE